MDNRRAVYRISAELASQATTPGDLFLGGEKVALTDLRPGAFFRLVDTVQQHESPECEDGSTIYRATADPKPVTRHGELQDSVEAEGVVHQLFEGDPGVFIYYVRAGASVVLTDLPGFRPADAKER